jgi:hypothetical protein
LLIAMVRNSRTVNESRGARGKCVQLPSYMEGGRPGVLTHGPFQKAFVFRPNLPCAMGGEGGPAPLCWCGGGSIPGEGRGKQERTVP